MAKRRAEEPLENSAYQDSPSVKKVRVDSVPEGNTRSNDFSHSAFAPLAETSQNGGYKAARLQNEDEELEDATVQDIDLNEEASAFTSLKLQQAPTEGYNDLYLDTIDRGVLDFDFEKLCSVTLSNINVYACLVCGKYFQGRGPKSHAYFHALEVGHHVYINMQTKRIYVLPEGYEVNSKSLDDIKFVVDPHLSKEEVLKLDREGKDAWDLGGKKYRPGKWTTYAPVVV